MAVRRRCSGCRRRKCPTVNAPQPLRSRRRSIHQGPQSSLHGGSSRVLNRSFFPSPGLLQSPPFFFSTRLRPDTQTLTRWPRSCFKSSRGGGFESGAKARVSTGMGKKPCYDVWGIACFGSGGSAVPGWSTRLPRYTGQGLTIAV